MKVSKGMTERRELVRKLYDEGMSAQDISKVTGIENHIIHCLTYRMRRLDGGFSDAYLAKQKERGERRALVLKTLDDKPQMTNKAIAEYLGLTLGTVAGIITRFRGSKDVKVRCGLKEGKVRELCLAGVSDREIASQCDFTTKNAVQAFRKRRQIFGPNTHKEKPQQPYAERYQKPLAVQPVRAARNRGDAIMDKAARAKMAEATLFDNPAQVERMPAQRMPLVAEVVIPVFRVGNCQFPMWGDNERTHLKEDGTPHFCGAPSAGSWCAEHRRRVFTTPKRWEREVRRVLLAHGAA